MEKENNKDGTQRTKKTKEKEINNELNDLRIIICLRKSEVTDLRISVCNFIENMMEHGIHCLPCSNTNDVIDLLTMMSC